MELNVSDKLLGDIDVIVKYQNSLLIHMIAAEYKDKCDAKTLITHPATTTHRVLEQDERQKLGITDNLVRISVGLENVDDLKQDLEQALKN